MSVSNPNDHVKCQNPGPIWPIWKKAPRFHLILGGVADVLLDEVLAVLLHDGLTVGIAVMPEQEMCSRKFKIGWELTKSGCHVMSPEI